MGCAAEDRERKSLMRLQKYLAQSGVASRRASEKLIAEGHVTVNGQKITEMGVQVEETDQVAVDGKLVHLEEEKHYLLYNKPIGEVTTVSDPEGRPTVLDKFREYPVRLVPAGRLDFDSEGLLLLTNDGDVIQRVLHPSHEVDKTYLARVTGQLSEEEIHRLRAGVVLDDGFRTSPARVNVIRVETFASAVLITIHEGHNRQVRRMMEAVGHKVLLLRRVKFGPIDLRGLARGEWRDLTDAEVRALKAL